MTDNEGLLLAIKDPHFFIKQFTKEEFTEFLNEGTNEDLKAMLKRYEEAELYEVCIEIRDLINSRVREGKTL